VRREVALLAKQGDTLLADLAVEHEVLFRRVDIPT